MMQTSDAGDLQFVTQLNGDPIVSLDKIIVQRKHQKIQSRIAEWYSHPLKPVTHIGKSFSDRCLWNFTDR